MLFFRGEIYPTLAENGEVTLRMATRYLTAATLRTLIRDDDGDNDDDDNNDNKDDLKR